MLTHRNDYIQTVPCKPFNGIFTSNTFCLVENNSNPNSLTTDIPYAQAQDGLILSAANIAAKGQPCNAVVLSSNTNFYVQVATGGVVPVLYDQTLNYGDPVTTSAAGKAVKAADGDWIIGYATETITTAYSQVRSMILVRLTPTMNTDGSYHFVAHGSGLTAAIANGFGSVTVSGNSSRGRITLSTGSGSPNTSAVNHSFTYPFLYAPTVIITPSNSAAAAAVPYVSSVSTTGFTVTFTSAPSNQTLSYNYMVIA